ncbi:MAG: 3-methyladenine DNA glycosylase 2 [Methylococcales bacterium]|nr:3-methyladenine DNA glycosylase 2 [Methylococcales bacterium]
MIQRNLPHDYRRQAFLAFHGRDTQALAEQVTARGLRKGLLWQGRPVYLAFHFSDTDVVVSGDMDDAALTTLADNMLGLAQPIALFERMALATPLGRVVQAQQGLRIALAATPFEALTWAITSQQISVPAALAMRRKLIRAAGVRLPDGLYCYPDAARLAALTEEIFRGVGFPRSKAMTLAVVSRLVADGEWVLQAATEAEFQALAQRLLAIPGIGPWTVNYSLMRGLGYLDGSLHGDAGVRRGIQHLLARPEAVNAAFARDWLAPFAPWRGLVAAHLWAFQD